jgi:hypothetical protein
MPKTVVLSQWMLLFEMLFLTRVTFVILINIYRERVLSCLRAQENMNLSVYCVCVFCVHVSYLALAILLPLVIE